MDQVQLGAKFDPVTEGQYEAEPPVWKPREYFLRVLESRVKQVKREWHNTVFCILQRIQSHVGHKPCEANPHNGCLPCTFTRMLTIFQLSDS